MVGATIQDGQFSLIIRFRCYTFVILGDIGKMHRQFLIREQDRKFQKILWQEKGTINEYQLNTVTFGFASAPFLAIRCLHQLADDEGHKYPLAAKILKRDFYVDNLITGASTREGTREIYEQMTALLSLAYLNMRQWASNDSEILAGVNEKSLDDSFRMNKDCVLKAKLFDPLGLLGPIILYAKLIMQRLWESKITWDESVPTSFYSDWFNFCHQLYSINTIKFNRNVLINNTHSIQLQGSIFYFYLF